MQYMYTKGWIMIRQLIVHDSMLLSVFFTTGIILTVNRVLQ